MSDLYSALGESDPGKRANALSKVLGSRFEYFIIRDDNTEASNMLKELNDYEKSLVICWLAGRVKASILTEHKVLELLSYRRPESANYRAKVIEAIDILKRNIG